MLDEIHYVFLGSAKTMHVKLMHNSIDIIIVWIWINLKKWTLNHLVGLQVWFGQYMLMSVM